MRTTTSHFGKCTRYIRCVGSTPATQDASHHQDDCISSISSRTKPALSTGIQAGGYSLDPKGMMMCIHQPTNQRPTYLRLQNGGCNGRVALGGSFPENQPWPSLHREIVPGLKDTFIDRMYVPKCVENDRFDGAKCDGTQKWSLGKG